MILPGSYGYMSRWRVGLRNSLAPSLLPLPGAEGDLVHVIVIPRRSGPRSLPSGSRAARRNPFGSPPGRSAFLRPARRAAMVFSLTPPMGSTRPVRVSSPVMPSFLRTGLPVIIESRAVVMVTPAEGPSLGVAPAGTCRWTKWVSKKSFSAPYFSRCAMT